MKNFFFILSLLYYTLGAIVFIAGFGAIIGLDIDSPEPNNYWYAVFGLIGTVICILIGRESARRMNNQNGTWISNAVIFLPFSILSFSILYQFLIQPLLLLPQVL